METDNLKVLTLDNIATLKSLIGSGGGGGTLYSEYGTNTDGALTQAFVSNVLNGNQVVLGSSAGANLRQNQTSEAIVLGMGASSQIGTKGMSGDASAHRSIVIGSGAKAYCARTGNYGVSIGYNAATGSSNALTITGALYNRNIAIGYNSQALESDSIAGSVAIGTNSNVNRFGVAVGSGANTNSTFNSVALGALASNTRDLEVSIGRPGGTGQTASSRYLANVTAGALDTDATNVAQVRSVAIGEVLYTSAEASSTITLSSPISQYEKIEIIGSWTMPYTPATTPLQVIEHWHLNDQDFSRTFQLHAEDIDVENQERTDVVETWTFSNATTIDLLSSAVISGSLAAPTAENSSTPNIIITKVVGFKAI